MSALIHRIALLLVLCCAAFTARADERILSYDSQISIQRDGAMEVVETIRVRAEGDQIRRGIYRDFPTDYKDALGHRYRVAFDFQGATRDDITEQWHSESLSNGVRIYLGSSETLLEPGEYRYTLRYRTNRQLGFFAQHDELYWNVTGNGWAFPIDVATATISLPAPVDTAALKASGYTGPQGSLQTRLTATTLAGGASYSTTLALDVNEGLTVVLTFPKGVVIAPDTAQKIRWLLQDNLQLLFGLVGLILLWAWYGLRWRAVGRDPALGVRIPLYQPPAGYSPASLRFVRRMGYDKTCFAATLLSLAAKGMLKIEQDSNDVVTLVKVPGADRKALAAGEAQVLDTLLTSKTSLRLEKSASTASMMSTAESAHRKALATDYEKKYFVTNRMTVIVGVVISAIAQIAAALSASGEVAAGTLFVIVFLSFWSLPVYALYSAALRAFIDCLLDKDA